MGTLDIISGPMFSGKSTMLLQKLIIETEIGFKILYINHSKDTRSTEPYSTHNPLYKEKLCKMNNISLISVPYLGDIDVSRYDVIGIDEAQFFDCCDLTESVTKMVEKEGKHVIAAGLTGDFRRVKFGALLDLEPLSDTFTKLSSFCQICANNNPKRRTPAPFTHRKIGDELEFNSVDVGGCEKYIPVCRKCYIKEYIYIPNLKVKDYNNVWVYGRNDFGQLGLRGTTRRVTPEQIPNLKAKFVACGSSYTAIIDQDDNILVCGSNEFGQLGLGDTTQIPNIKVVYREIFFEVLITPTQIPNIKVKFVACGNAHTAIIDQEGNTLMFGNNDYGQLGLGDTKDRRTPTQIPNLKANLANCGGNHTAIIDLENNVLTFGGNGYGQLGLGDTTQIPNIKVVYREIITPTHIPNTKAKLVSCGGAHTAIIDLENNVLTFGGNYCGSLGLGDTKDRLTPEKIPEVKAKFVNCGGVHTAIIDQNDNVLTFGGNQFGQLGLGDSKAQYTTPTQIPNLKARAKLIACGQSHTAIIDQDDNVLIFGNNGQFGVGDKKNKFTPKRIPNQKAKLVSCGFNHTIIIN